MAKIQVGDRIIEMEPLAQPSATIIETGYDADGRILLVRFRNNVVYKYTPILPEAYRALKESPSAGSFLQQNIVKNNLVTTQRLGVTAS